MKIGFVSLGCSKNLVDTEMMIGLAQKNNLEIVNNEKEAEIIVVNTCGFIESAKQEAINTILEMAEYKVTGNCKYLIATGCLVQRYKEELIKSIPEVDLFISVDEYNNFGDILGKLINSKIQRCSLEYEDRYITTGNATAYLKIAEGCSNRCTYCAIPYIRGPYVSRKMEDILEEAKRLNDMGIKEVIVIAQDTTKYGEDIYGKKMLPELLEKLSEFPNFKWIRFLYAYPESMTDELIQVVKNNPKICKYFDLPIQHASNSILKLMNRRTTIERIDELLGKIRKEIPDAILRTSLIVGFPGETEEDFESLYKFVEKTKFDKLGVFEYSKEDGTPAAKLKGQVSAKIKNLRWNKIMELQQKISEEKLKENIGKEYEVLVEKVTNKYIIGRTKKDVPDMDGLIYIKNTEQVNIGEFITCTVTSVKEYDLIGMIKNKALV
ncbi:MAG: 30S ribosomal protein S12 methylthiotransferase RimO [Clostridia bacterium]|nr:30S ribosomal protein S12 methylthiotransferase RimO [Clostridia bacterium]